MKNRIGLILVLAVFVFCMAEYLEAGSIWAKRDKNMRDLYADNVAHRIGDVLTIKIVEDSKVDNKAKRDLQKDTDKSITFNGEIGKYADIGDFGLSAASSNNLKGKADYKDERSFVDSITVVVVDVLPNGNLVVLGTRSREIAGDTQTIEVSGIVQPIDIAFDNTIVSQRVANFRIFTKNAGVAEPYTRQGWLGRIFDVIWPF